MSVNLPVFYTQQYSSLVALLLQQKGSKLRGSVMNGTYVGKQGSPVNQVGKISMQPVTTRFAPMGRVDAPLDRRWVYPSDFDLPQLVDTFDLLKTIADPKSAYVQNAVYAAGRKMDELILAAINGTNKTGETGATSTILPTAQKVAVNFGAASAVGLSVAKLRQAKKILMAANLDLESEELYCPIAAAQHDNLLAEVQIISSDFNGGDQPVLKEGKIMRFLGINFIHTELLEVSSTTQYAPVYAKSGVHLGLWNDMTSKVSQRDDLQGLPWQIYMYMSAGATRIEEQKVVQIACDIS